MSKQILYFDFETKDPYVSRNLGSGWCYPNSDFKVLGVALKTEEDDGRYMSMNEQTLEILKGYVDRADILVAHNAQYDLGCLEYLGVDYKDKDIVDTEVMSRLFNSSLLSHSLDNLAKKYLGHKKENDLLVEVAQKEDIIDNKRMAPSKWVKLNLDKVQEVAFWAVQEYAITDVELTDKLYNYFLNASTQPNFLKLAIRYSNLSKICISYRAKGVPIDLKRAREVREELAPIIAGLFQDVYDLAGEEFNLKSPKDMPRIFDKLKISYPLTPKGNPSITSPWMEQHTHPICKAIVKARKYKNISDNFIQKIIDMQVYTLGLTQEEVDNCENGFINPELNLLRARTGRFSCSSPNIQQIPSRDAILGPLCRSIFTPFSGERWYSLDFSNQEGRLQVHYAEKLECEGGALLGEEFRHDPRLDMHQKVADLAGISRTEAKVVNLGLSYGMGIDKLASNLGITAEQAKHLRNKYNDLAPFLDQLNKKCKDAMKKNQFIRTVGGRRSHVDPPMFTNGERKTFEYKALNKLIQGSAADQTIAAMEWAYKEGIPVLFPVHDELNMSGTKEQAERLKYIMENATPLNIPCLTDIGEGDNWNEAH